MPPPEYTAEALKGVQASALAIVDERRALNDAFDQLRKAALALGYELNDDGSIRGRLTGSEIAKPQATTPEYREELLKPDPPAPAPEQVPPTSGGETMTRLSEREPEPAEEEAREPVETPTLKQRIKDTLAGGRRRTAEAIAREMGEDSRRIKSNLSPMRAKGEVLRDEQLQYFLPAPTITRRLPDAERPPTAPPSEPKAEGSGTTDQARRTVATPAPSGPQDHDGRRPPPADPTKPARDEDEQHVYSWNVKRQRWSATKKGEYKLQVKEREENMLRVFDFLVSRPNRDWTAGELGDQLDLDRAMCNTLLKEGKDRGFFYVADRRRSSTSPPGTRFSDAFKAHDGKFATISKLSPMDRFPFWDGKPVAQPPKAELPRDTSRQRSRAGIDKTLIRGAVVKLGKFTMSQLVKELQPEVSIHDNDEMKKYSKLIEPVLSEFTTKGMLICHLHPGIGKEWAYKKPTEPGKAAQMDAQRGKGLASHEARAPVAGTGGNTPYARAMKRASKEVKGMLEQVAGKVGEDKIGVTKEGHFAIKKPGGGQVIIAPNSNSSGYVKDRARLRREGLISA